MLSWQPANKALGQRSQATGQHLLIMQQRTRLCGQDCESEDTVGEHARTDDQRALRDGAIFEQVGIVRGEAILGLWIILWERDVASQRY